MDKTTRFRAALDDVVNGRQISKRALARMARVSRSHLEKILEGSCVPTIDVADRIADACGVPLEKMLASRKTFKKDAVPA